MMKMVRINENRPTRKGLGRSGGRLYRSELLKYDDALVCVGLTLTFSAAFSSSREECVSTKHLHWCSACSMALAKLAIFCLISLEQDRT
jgi:hypothetical protein